MVFARDDIYTSSGSTKLYNSWTPYVTKYDTSSFYSWEQDNLPLYDLEERTYELWEQQGFPTSSTPGLSLAVSADAPLHKFVSDSMVFRDVSSCMAAIPKVVRFPVLIEVCNFGDLGNLELHNIRMEEGGSIEIINRAYGHIYDARSKVADTEATYVNDNIKMMDQVFSPDLSATLYASGTDLSSSTTSSLILSSTVLSGTGDVRASAVSFSMYPTLSQRKGAASMTIKKDPWSVTSPSFKTYPYEAAVDTGVDNTLATLDVSAASQYAGDLIRRANITGGTSSTGNCYLNSLQKLSIRNCDGPIYVRNFFVDGESQTAGGRDLGIEVTNSDVLLENCTAVRCREAGFKFNNSKVILSRTAFSYRNYTLTSTTTRKANTGVGFHAVNSDVSISALVSATTETGVAGFFQASGNDVAVVASRNHTGFKLDNSRLHGGFQRLVRTSEDSGGITTAELNTGLGMEIINSEVNLKGLLDIYGNQKGMEATNSDVTFENFCVEYHSDTGIDAKNSVFTFDSAEAPTVVGEAGRKQLDFLENSQHIDFKKQSTFGFARKNSIPDKYGHTSFDGTHGVIKWGGASRANLPAISLKDNSNADFLHTKLIARTAASAVPSVPGYGLGVRAVDNSEVSFFGTGSGATFIWGPAGYVYQTKTAGLYADNQSTINLFGPTLIAQFGVDVLAENQSTINISPPRVRDSYMPEVSGFNLSSTLNHTSVELHSTRACLVANKNSTINLEDLGAYPCIPGVGPPHGRWYALTDGT